MNVALQWIAVGIIVAAALVYLVRQLTKSSKGECAGCCACKNADENSSSQATSNTLDCLQCPSVKPKKKTN